MSDQHWLGIDIGGTSMKIALVNHLGEISKFERILLDKARLSTIEFLDSLKDRVLNEIQLSEKEIVGVGIAIPGFQMEDGSGALFSINLPFLNGINIKGFVEEFTNLETVITNDLVAHSLAEHRFGAGKNVQNFLSVSMGTGIGHTFIKDGSPLIITNGISGDSARMIVDQHLGIADFSGMQGTAEALCGVHAIEVLANQFYPADKVYQAYDVISLAKAGKDPVARAIMTIISQRLAVYLVNLSSIYLPDVISITGGQTESGEFFITECENEFRKLSHGFFDQCYQLIGRNKSIRIMKSISGGLTGLIGSVVPMLEREI